MRNGTKTWRRMTIMLDTFDKVLLSMFALPIILFVAVLAMEPTWGNAWDVISHLITLFVFWRWFWLEGYKRRFHLITDLGAIVGAGAYEHGEVIVAKVGDHFRVVPLTKSRDT